MKPFEKPIVNVIAFTCEDHITESSNYVAPDDEELDDEGFNNTVVKP